MEKKKFLPGYCSQDLFTLEQRVFKGEPAFHTVFCIKDDFSLHLILSDRKNSVESHFSIFFKIKASGKTGSVIPDADFHILSVQTMKNHFQLPFSVIRKSVFQGIGYQLIQNKPAGNGDIDADKNILQIKL